MKTQHDDLVEAGEDPWEGIIEELDTAMRKQFTEKFARSAESSIKYSKNSLVVVWGNPGTDGG